MLVRQWLSCRFGKCAALFTRCLRVNCLAGAVDEQRPHLKPKLGLELKPPEDSAFFKTKMLKLNFTNVAASCKQ
jgi:hypothetical protein